MIAKGNKNKRNTKKKNIIIISILSLVLLFSMFFMTDSIRCKNDKDPIFCIHYGTYKDGGSKHFIGLGYNYYKIVNHTYIMGPNNDETCLEENRTFDYVITPWFCDINNAKEQLNKKNK